MNTKGEVVTFLAVVLAVGLVLAIVYGLVQEGSKECRHDSDCKENSYCGSDFKCHQMPLATGNQYDFKWPAIIIGASLIIAAWIFRGKSKNKGAEVQNVYKP